MALAWQAYQAGNLVEAARLYRQMLQDDADNADVWLMLGVVCRGLGDLDESVKAYHEVLRLRPGSVEVQNNLGAVLVSQGKLEEALTCYRHILNCRPGYVEAHSNLGAVLASLGQLEEAVACYREAIRLKPTHADAYSNLGAALVRLDKPEEALAACQQALQLMRHSAATHNSLGTALVMLDRIDEGLAHYQQAVRLQPHFVEAHLNHGNAFTKLGQPKQAQVCYDKVLQLQPDHVDGHLGRALASLQQGDLPQGFAEFEWRWQTKNLTGPLRFPRPHWDGSALVGRTILLAFEQGLGDTLQFIRYAPLVKQRGATVVVACQKPLLGLLAGCSGIDHLVAFEEAWPEHDVHAMLLSLPRIFGTTLETIPGNVPYLSADARLVERWRQELGGQKGFKVGIVWQGNRQHRWDKYRSVPLEQFAPLARLAGVHLYSLQKGSGIEQLQTRPEPFPITDLGSRLDESSGAFLDTAAVMKNLDLVITADTAAAHLAGALGVPVWVALWSAPDWRWLLQREDSPWFPTMRLFRQTALGDWAGVFQRLAAALQAELAKRGGTSSIPTTGPIAARTDLPAPPCPPASDGATMHAARPTDDHLARAWQCHQADDYEQAESLCRQILEAQPEQAEAWRLLGEVCLFQGKYAQAVAGYQQALRLGPGPAESYNNLGVALTQQDQPDEAIGYYRQALGLKPDYVEAANNLGVALTQQGQLSEAVALLREALRHKPDYAEAHNSLGIALEAQGLLDEAVACYHQALRYRPNYPKAYNNLGIALAAQGKLDEAVASYRQSLRLSPNSSDAGNNLAAVLVQQGKWDEAVLGCRQALQADPANAEAHNNLAVALAAQGKLDDALAGYSRALQLKPDYADSHRNMALALLKKGDFTQGWREYEWRWRCKDSLRTPYEQPLWDGSALAGRTLLLLAEQGLGDTLQFIRYAPLVQQRGGRVVAACQQALLPLLAGCQGIDHLVPREGPLPPFDVFAPLLSLPRILGTTLDRVPADVPYLHARPELIELLAERAPVPRELLPDRHCLARQSETSRRSLAFHSPGPLRAPGALARGPAVQLAERSGD